MMTCDIVIVNDVDFEYELALLEEATNIIIEFFGVACTKDEEGEDLPLGVARVPHPLALDIGANKILVLEQKDNNGEQR